MTRSVSDHLKAFIESGYPEQRPSLRRSSPSLAHRLEAELRQPIRELSTTRGERPEDGVDSEFKCLPQSEEQTGRYRDALMKLLHEWQDPLRAHSSADYRYVVCLVRLCDSWDARRAAKLLFPLAESEELRGKASDGSLDAHGTLLLALQHLQLDPETGDAPRRTGFWLSQMHHAEYLAITYRGLYKADRELAARNYHRVLEVAREWPRFIDVVGVTFLLMTDLKYAGIQAIASAMHERPSQDSNEFAQVIDKLGKALTDEQKQDLRLISSGGKSHGTSMAPTLSKAAGLEVSGMRWSGSTSNPFPADKLPDSYGAPVHKNSGRLMHG
jgi:hypothetical protein